MRTWSTVGRLRYEIVLVRARTADVDAFRLGPTDLPSVVHLLAASPDHLERLASGSELWALPGESGAIAGVVWMNGSTHDDKFLGGWSRPSPSRVYLNQLMVDRAHRRRGVATELIRAVSARAEQLGRSEVAAVVDPNNAASLGAFSKAGGETVGSLYGVRLGRLGTLRRTR